MSSVASAAAAARPGWAMPLVPEDFDRRPLTPEERRALALSHTTAGFNGRSREGRAATDALARLYRPLEEVFRLSAIRAPQ